MRAEFDEATARETLALGAKAVTADVAHTAARARVNFMVKLLCRLRGKVSASYTKTRGALESHSFSSFFFPLHIHSLIRIFTMLMHS